MKKACVAVCLLLASCGSDQQANKDPCSITAVYSSNFAAHPTKGRVMLIGDSITSNLGTHTKEDLVNRGVPGNYSACLAAEYDAHIALEQPAEVIIAIGINDIHYGMPADQFAINYATFVDRLLDSGVEVKIRSILPSNQMSALVPEYNARLMKIAEDRGVTYLDTYPFFVTDTGGLALEYTIDGTHLSEVGYRVYLEHFWD